MSWWPFFRSESQNSRHAVDVHADTLGGDIHLRAATAQEDNLKDDSGILAALWSGAATGSSSLSGASALRVPAVAAAVRVISEACACLPIRIMERADDGTEKEDTSHPIGVLLRGDVNPWTAGHELVRDLVATALVRDFGGLAFVNRIDGEVREIIKPPDAVLSVQYDPATGEPIYRQQGELVDHSTILHIRGPFDKAPVTLAAEAIGVSREMEVHASNLFKKGARPSGIIKFPNSPTLDALKRAKGMWQQSYGGSGKSGETAVLYGGADFQPLTFKSTDAQFLELRKFQILEICRAFRVSPSLLFDFDRATWSNAEQAGKEFLLFTLEPWIRTVEAALTRSLLSQKDRPRLRVLLDRDDITQADLTARATAISSLIAARVLNANEARGWLDLSPYKGGDVYANPNVSITTPPGPGHNGGPPIDDKEPAA